MRRLALIGLSLYGFVNALEATRNTLSLARAARRGDRAAAHHFTQTRYAHVLGPRNSDLGMAYYTLLQIAASTGLWRRRPVLLGLRVASLVAAGLSAYLLWALLFRLRVGCPICLRGHAVNGMILLLLWTGDGRRQAG